MSSAQSKFPTDPSRVKAFASFFKNYMAVSTIVVAALPIPVTSLHLISTYNFQTKVLSVYTPLFCFLVLAFIFFIRHSLARMMFGDYFATVSSLKQGPKNEAEAGTGLNGLVVLVVGFLIILSFAFAVAYHLVLNSSVLDLMSYGDTTYASFNEALQQADPLEVRNGYQAPLMILYLGIFICAEAAFVLMAIKEYLQDYLKLDDADLMLASGTGQVPETQTHHRSASL